MRVGIYDRFWHSMGGGERHAGMIGQILAADGAQVDLIGHTKVSLNELGSRLALDLSRTTLRVVPDRGEADLSELTADYDLFVNGTYMSRVVSKARRSAYLCFFPTPFDHEMSAPVRLAVRTVGPLASEPTDRAHVWHGTGWFPPEGGLRRRWKWTSGSGLLHLPPGRAVTLRADFGRPGSDTPVEVSVTGSDGEVLDRFLVQSTFAERTWLVPPSEQRRTITVSSQTFTPAGGDDRSLGVAISRLRIDGFLAGPRERLGGRFPWLLRNPSDLSFLSSYDLVMANSSYTREWIERLWRTDAEILYPPIEVGGIRPGLDREPIVLAVGRFFGPEYGHSKRQLEMVRIFAELHRSRQLPGWRLVLAGGCEDYQRGYLDAVQEAAAGLPVDIHANAPRSLVESLFSTASVFWSATGLNENTTKRPWTNEHFGMTTAEAMAGGCVPVVIDRAGQREIVREGIDGFRWADAHECRVRTVQVATDAPLRSRLAASAVQQAQQFSDTAFAHRWHELQATHDLGDIRRTA